MKSYTSPALVPSSMSAGNTVADSQALSQTAPGSTSISPVPDAMDHLPLPEASVHIEVNPQRDRIQGNAAPSQGGPWAQPGYMDEGSTDQAGWRQT